MNAHSTLALIISFIVFLLVGVALSLSSGVIDVYAVESVILVVPFAALAYFVKKGKSWSFILTSLLGAVLLVLVGFESPPVTEPVLVWESTLATVLFALMSLEAFKAYLETKS